MLKGCGLVLLGIAILLAVPVGGPWYFLIHPVPLWLAVIDRLMLVGSGLVWITLGVQSWRECNE